MSDHFAAFSFVDRITEFAPGHACARLVRGPARYRRVSVVPGRRGGRTARGVGRDGQARLPRTAGRGAGDRNPVRGRASRPAICWSSTSTSTIATMKSSPTAAGRRSTAGGSSSSGTAWVRCCRSRSSIRRRRCASASRCCAAEVRPPARFRGVRAGAGHRRCARAGQVAARHADGARACGILRRSFSAPSGVSGDAAARRCRCGLPSSSPNSLGESRGAAAMTPSRMTNVKMRTFITPGQQVGINVEMLPAADDGATGKDRAERPRRRSRGRDGAGRTGGRVLA